jgi:molybdopterin synthase catalytic subunit
MDDQIHLPTGVIASAFIGASIAFVGWVIKTALGETLSNLRKSIEANVKATDRLASIMDKLSDRQLDHEARISALEGRKHGV